MTSDKMVVVIEPVTLLQHRERDVFAARFVKLGLTGYGRTEERALLELKRLFNSFVHRYRELGQIEKRLKQAGVEWYWGDDYPKDRPAFEDTNKLFGSTWYESSPVPEKGAGLLVAA